MGVLRGTNTGLTAITFFLCRIDYPTIGDTPAYISVDSIVNRMS